MSEGFIEWCDQNNVPEDRRQELYDDCQKVLRNRDALKNFIRMTDRVLSMKNEPYLWKQTWEIKREAERQDKARWN